MASFGIDGIEQIKDMLDRLEEIPNDTVNEILEAMGNVAAEGQRTEGHSESIYDPLWAGTHVLDSIKVTKPTKNKNGVPSISVTFKGTRTRGNTKTRNAEIAFVNEFGKENMVARPFISTANTKYADKIYKAGADVFDKWLESIEKE